MFGGNFIGCVHALLPSCKTTPCWPIAWLDRAAGPMEDRPSPAAHFAKPGEAAMPSRLPAKPSSRVTEIAPDHGHGESRRESPPAVGLRTPVSNRASDPTPLP